MSLTTILTAIRRYWTLILLAVLIAYYYYTRYVALHVHHKTNQQVRAQHPKIDKRWIRRIPEGLIIGKSDNSHYYCIPEKATEHGFEMQHCLVIGGSGTGKTSSVYADSLLANWDNAVNRPELAYHVLAIDIKGELHQNFCPSLIRPDLDAEDANLYYLLDPTDRDYSVGYDPFADLGDYPSRDQTIQTSSDIAAAYVPVSDKDRYFSSNAQTMLAGFVAACIESSPRIDLVSMMQRVLAEGVKAVMEDVMSRALPGSATIYFLGRYQGKGQDNESLDDIISTMTTSLTCFALDSVAYMLRDNPVRIGTSAIRRKSVILSVPDYLLDEQTFAPVYRMILTLEQRYLTSRIPEPGTPPMVLFYDELYSLGGSENGKGIPGLQHFVSIARGYGCAVIAAIQSTKMLEQQYGREGARILEDNMAKCILQITDPDTIKAAVDWTGKYTERRVSTSDSNKMTSTVSWSQEPIFDSSDFAALAGRKKVIIIPVNDKFCQIRKSQWFADPYFKQLQKQITKQPSDK